MKAGELTTAELVLLLGEGGATLVDALPPAPYAVRHLPGALNVTAEDDVAGVRRALPDQEQKIVVYSTDAACSRAPDLAAPLIALGYTDVSVDSDGIAGWVSLGHPVETSDASL